MMVPTFLATMVAIFAVVHNLWVIGNLWFARRWIWRQRSREHGEQPQTSVTIMLPMFDETAIAVRTINYFTKLDYPPTLIRLVVITTLRECSEGQTTSDLVSEHLESSCFCNVFHIVADGTDTFKADQLNQAIGWLDKESPDWWTESSVIGVYDADSRPEINSLRNLDSAVRDHPQHHAFQQPAVYIAGFDELPGGLIGAYLRSRPLYNLRFCLYREIPGFLRSTGLATTRSWLWKTLVSSPNHFLGHGEFIRLSTLRSVGGFPRPSADTSLGTVLSFLGYAIVPLSTFDLGETPANVRMLLLQSANWYAGCALYGRDCKLARDLSSGFATRHIVMMTKRFVENMIWAIGPLLLIFAFLFAFVTSQSDIGALCFIAFMLHGISVGMIAQEIERLCQSNKFACAVHSPLSQQFPVVLGMYPAMLVLNCFGPILYYGWLVRSWFTKREVPRSKTTRIGV